MKKIILGSAVFLTPALAFAQLEEVKGWVDAAGQIVSALIPIAAALALLYFFWGLGKFILKAGDSDAQKEARGMMIWGIVALFIITSIWGITTFLGSQLNIDQAGDVDVPGFSDTSRIR